MWLLIFIVPLLIWLDMHIFRFFFGLIFSDIEDFNDSVKYTFTPDLFSLFRGEYFKDRFAEFKLSVFIGLCVVTILIEIWIVSSLLSAIF